MHREFMETARTRKLVSMQKETQGEAGYHKHVQQKSRAERFRIANRISDGYPEIQYC